MHHGALTLASILQTTIQHIARLTDYLTDRQLLLCKMAETESEAKGPPSSKRKALSGATTYKTKFNIVWKEDYPFC